MALGKKTPKTHHGGTEGGHILFGGGNVEFFDQIDEGELREPDGSPTQNISDCFTSTDRILQAN